MHWALTICQTKHKSYIVHDFFKSHTNPFYRSEILCLESLHTFPRSNSTNLHSYAHLYITSRMSLLVLRYQCSHHLRKHLLDDLLGEQPDLNIFSVTTSLGYFVISSPLLEASEMMNKVEQMICIFRYPP